MKSRVGYLVLSIVSLALWTGAGCPGLDGLASDNQQPPTKLTITIFNDSCSTYIAPKFGVCPNGMAQPPHHFVEPPAVIAPGKSVTYTTDQVAGAADGNCATFSTEFMVGVPGWGYGPTSNPDTMTYVETRYVGLIGVQFHCGDTIKLRWSNCISGGEGTWTSEVIPATGNPAPTASFGPP
ncbi:MAG TPA: hypothetical protein VLM89_13655 [Phycisphaerae bacterium]|nr:hypothetical protein [Phycisphaerae bacterium]